MAKPNILVLRALIDHRDTAAAPRQAAYLKAKIRPPLGAVVIRLTVKETVLS
jgi:hypothetical protein